MRILETDVLIVGGGPAGLTVAALLARAGVDALTVTKYAATANSPRAHITNQRTVEIFRDLGIEDRVMARALPQNLMGKQVFATSFAGREFARMMTWGTGDDRIADYRTASPCEMCNAPQHILEPIQLEAAREFGADIRFNHEVVALEQSPEKVIARIRQRDTGDEFEVHARYAIGCDGAKSLVGEQGGFEYEGQHGLAHAITVWIEADLTKYTKHRSGALFFVCGPGGSDIFSVWTCVEPWTEWSTIFASHGGAKSDTSDEAVMRRVREAIGDPDVEIKIKNVARWQINHVVAADYRKGRLFVAGDAAHRHPPANGLGSNTSIQDAYNLAWKLALVTSGRANERLLDSYSAERQPVGRQIVDRANQSVREMGALFAALRIAPDQTREEGEALMEELLGPDGAGRREEMRKALELANGQFNAHGVEMGQRYVSDAVVSDGTPFPPHERDADLYYAPTSHPGASLPHVWLERDRVELSTLDLCAYDRFTLILGVGGAAWESAAREVAREFDVPIETVVVGLGQPVADVLDRWSALREGSDEGCVLVRPDRFVAWRSHGLADDPTAALRGVMAGILKKSV